MSNLINVNVFTPFDIRNNSFFEAGKSTCQPGAKLARAYIVTIKSFSRKTEGEGV